MSSVVGPSVRVEGRPSVGAAASLRLVLLWAPLIGYASLYLLPASPAGSPEAAMLPAAVVCFFALSTACVLESRRLLQRNARETANVVLLATLTGTVAFSWAVLYFVTLASGVGPAK